MSDAGDKHPQQEHHVELEDEDMAGVAEVRDGLCDVPEQAARGRGRVRGALFVGHCIVGTDTGA